MSDLVTCIIAARYKSSRFEGKPLHLIHGKPMIVWVAQHATQASQVKNVIVATDDGRIYDVVTKAGYKAVYTSEFCPDGSSRVAEAASNISDELIFEMQGDQPLVTPDLIDTFIVHSLKLMRGNKNIAVVIPFTETTKDQTQSRDILKVVVSNSNKLLFQTRYPIETGYRTLGLYLWKRKTLQNFVSSKVSNIEKAEDSHPIRLYVNDVYVQGVRMNDSSWVEVDRLEHVPEVEKIMNEKGIV